MKRNWFWGMFLLLSAVFIIASTRFDFMEIGLISIIGTLLCLAFSIQMLASKHFAGVFFPLGILYYIYQEPLGWPFIEAWILLAAALCATIGVAILEPKRKWHEGDYRYRYSTSKTGDEQNQVHGSGYADTDTNVDDCPNIHVSFSGVCRYFHSQNLKGGRLSCRFGSLELFLDNAKIAPEGAVFDVACSFGSIELHVPRGWRINDRTNALLGAVEFQPHPSGDTGGAPELTLRGEVRFGAVTIQYV